MTFTHDRAAGIEPGDQAREAEPVHLHPFRAAAHVPQPAVRCCSRSAFPLLLFFLVAGPNRHQKLSGINFATYYMVGMLSWGAMTAMIGGGARIAHRTGGQLAPSAAHHAHLPRAHVLLGQERSRRTRSRRFRSRLLYAAGVSMGVHLSAVHWLELTGYVLVALVPFAVIGIVLGHVLTVDSIGPAVGGHHFAVRACSAARGDRWRRVASSGIGEVPAVVLARAGRQHRGRRRRRGPRRRGW